MLGLMKYNDPQDTNNYKMQWLLYIFSFIYMVEIFIKVVAKGFYQGQHTFLKSLYNLLDLIALITFLLGFSLPYLKHYEIIKAYRLIQLLRSSGWSQLDILINVITNSFQYTVTIIGLLLYILGMMALLGQGLFQGLLLNRCLLPSGQLNLQIPRTCSMSTKYGYQCPQGNTCSLYQTGHVALKSHNYGVTHYDNIIQAWLTSFQLLQKSDWQDVMYILRDVQYTFLVVAYILVIIIICNYFIGNMILASMMHHYNLLTKKTIISKAQLASKSINQQKKKLVLLRNDICSRIKQYLQNIFAYKFQRSKMIKSYSPQRRFAYKFALHPLIQLIVYTILILYSVILCMDQYPTTNEQFIKISMSSYYVFDCFFILEQAIKLYGLGSDYYKNDQFNKFDFIITIISSFRIIGSNGMFNFLGAFRILRLFRLIINKNQIGSNLTILAETYFQLLPIYIAFFYLFSLNIYVFSIIGMNIFQGNLKFTGEYYDKDNGVSPRVNFDTLTQSIGTVFQITMRQKWNEIWYLCYVAVGSKAHFYFLFLIIIGQYIILQSFTAIVLGIFQQNRKKVMNKKSQTVDLISKFFNNTGNKSKILDNSSNKQDVVYSGTLSSKIKSKLQTVMNKVKKNVDIKPVISKDQFQKDYFLNILKISESSDDSDQDEIEDFHKDTSKMPKRLSLIKQNKQLSLIIPMNEQYSQYDKILNKFNSDKPNLEEQKKMDEKNLKEEQELNKKNRKKQKTFIFQSQYHKQLQSKIQTLVSKDENQNSVQKNKFQSPIRQNNNQKKDYIQRNQKHKRTLNLFDIMANRHKETRKQNTNNQQIKHYKQDSNFLDYANKTYTFKKKNVLPELILKKLTQLIPSYESDSSYVQQDSLQSNQIQNIQDSNSHVNQFSIFNNLSSNRLRKKEDNWFTIKYRQFKTYTFKQLIQYCKESSLFVFHQDTSKLRKLFARMLGTKFWDRFTLCLIFANGVLLAYDHPLKGDNNLKLDEIQRLLSLIFTSFFLTEMFMKIVSVGFIFNNRNPGLAYIRSYWNIIDFIVVWSSAISIMKPELRVYLKSLKVFRALRPLKVINKNKDLKVIVYTLFKVVPQLGNIIIIILLVLLVLAIIMMQTFKGTFFNCFDTSNNLMTYSESLKTKTDCLQQGHHWQNSFYNFDNIWMSMFTLFKMLTGGNWTYVLESTMDSQSIDVIPFRNAHVAYWYVFYFILVTSHVMLLNLVIGLVLDNYKETKDDLEGYLGLTHEQRQWADLQRFMQKRRLIKRVFLQENDRNNWTNLQRNCLRMGQSRLFDQALLIITGLHLVLAMCDHIGISTGLRNTIIVTDMICWSIYHLEFIIKFMGSR